MELTERQKKALKLKGDHEIYYEDDRRFAKEAGYSQKELEEAENWRIITDLEETDVVSTTGFPEGLNGCAYIPDFTPHWLYKIIRLWDCYEIQESKFEFDSEADANEFKAICDFVVE